MNFSGDAIFVFWGDLLGISIRREAKVAGKEDAQDDGGG